MSFASPRYFVLLFVVAPVLVFFIFGWIGREAAIRFSEVRAVRQAGATPLGLRRFFSGLLRLLGLVLLVIALARPQTSEGHSEQKREVIDIMMAIDISTSMATLDFQPQNRLEAAKAEAERFIKSRPDDRMGLVAFAKQSVTVSPLTTDHAALIHLLKGVRMGQIEDGTAIGVGLANALSRLRESDAKSKVAVLLTDGVNNSGEIDPPTAADIASKLGIRVYTIGMGSDGASMVPIQDPQVGMRLVRVVTQIDEKTLRMIAEKTHGLYFRTRDENGLRRVFDEISRLEKTEIKVDSFTTHQEHYMIFLYPAFMILLTEAVLTYLVWRKIP